MHEHIVCVVPFKASCDALERSIIENKESFFHLKDYEMANIAGVDKKEPKTIDVQRQIEEFEKNVKTLCITVNKMLTGTTVKYWDTMLYLKSTSSPQEYDQSIYRLQSPFIKTYYDNR